MTRSFVEDHSKNSHEILKEKQEKVLDKYVMSS